MPDGGVPLQREAKWRERLLSLRKALTFRRLYKEYPLYVIVPSSQVPTIKNNSITRTISNE